MDKRKAQMQELKDTGYAYSSIGKIFNVSRQRVHQILSGYAKPRKERVKKLSKAYIRIRQLVLARDNYTCQVCGQVSTRLYVHHKDHNGYGATNKPDNSLSNLITVCPSCHIKHHRNISTRNRDVVSLRVMGITYQEIGDMFGLSRQRIHQIYLVTTRRLDEAEWDKCLSVGEDT